MITRLLLLGPNLKYHDQFLSRVVGPLFKSKGENVLYEADKHISLQTAQDADTPMFGWKEVVGSSYTKGRFGGIDVEFSILGYGKGLTGAYESMTFVFDRHTGVGEGFVMRHQRVIKHTSRIKNYIPEGSGIKELDKYAVFKGNKEDLKNYLTKEKAEAVASMMKKRGLMGPVSVAIRNHKIYIVMEMSPLLHSWDMNAKLSQPLSEFELPTEVSTAIDDAIALLKDLTKGDKEMEMAW